MGLPKRPLSGFAWRYDSILVFYVCDRMFCLTDMDDFMSVTVKLTPDEIEELRMTRSSVGNPVNLSPRHWLQLNLNGDLSDPEILGLVSRAYEIVKAKYSRKGRQ